MDLSLLTPQNFIIFVAFLFLIYEVWDKGSKLIAKINAEHDRVKRWDNMEKIWTENLQAERDKIYARYDVKLENQDKKLEEIEQSIEEYKTETEAKIQQTQTELFILTQCMAAVLDGLKQMNCNGKVTEAQTLLDDYLVKKAHEQ